MLLWRVLSHQAKQWTFSKIASQSRKVLNSIFLVRRWPLRNISYMITESIRVKPTTLMDEFWVTFGCSILSFRNVSNHIPMYFTLGPNVWLRITTRSPTLAVFYSKISTSLHSRWVAPTDLIVDWIEQRYSQNEAKTNIIVVTGSKFMQQRTMWTTIANHEFMHEFMFRYCPSHCSLLHKCTSGYPNDACFGFVFDAKTGTLLLYPVYYEISGRTTFFHFQPWSSRYFCSPAWFGCRSIVVASKHSYWMLFSVCSFWLSLYSTEI